MTAVLDEAFRMVLVVEKRSLELYRQAAPRLDEAGRRVVERLAAKELQIIDRIRERLPEDAGDSLAAGWQDTPPLSEMTQTGLDLVELLRLALLEKTEALAKYQTCLEVLREPTLCGIFELATALSRELSATIAAEHGLAIQRLQRPMLNRRTKRAHIRSCCPASAPNQHSQLFISLRDSGRHHP